VAGVLGSRTLDRVGKGVRTAPRDALLASYVDSGSRGAAFGFHRAMDTTGAAIGPVIALIYLTFRPGDYRTLFFLAFVPSALAAVATLLIREERFVPSAERPSLRQLLSFWRQAPAAYRRIIIWLTLFSIANASDVFLILRARGAGVDERWAIGAYILYNFVYAATAYPGGKLSDRIGRKRVMVAGLLLYALVYAGFAAAGSEWAIWCLFPLYGVYAACTEGISKAWVSDLVPNEHRGLAIGLFTMLSSLGALVASSWTGALWSDIGPAVPLLTAGVVAAITAFGLLSVPTTLSADAADV
jgi:MFS family permease